MSTTLEQQLYQELENGNTKKALYIVKLMREDVNNLHRGKSPLVYAREFENEEVVNALTEKGAKEVVDADEVVKILLQDYDNAETIEERMKIAKLMNEFSELKGLTKVATSGHADVAKQMIVTGANVNNEDHRRSTVLIEAVKRGNVNVVEMLISAGANINQKDEDGNSVLSFVDSRMRKKIFNAVKKRYQNKPKEIQQQRQEVER